MEHTPRRTSAQAGGATKVRPSLLALALGALAMGGCGIEHDAPTRLGQVRQAITEDPLADSCGYELTDGTYATWPGGYQAWVSLENVSGPTATHFEVLVDVGDTTIVDGYLAEYEEVEGGYSVTAPQWLQWQQIPPGSSYQFQFIGAGEYEEVTPYLISINDQICDPEPPEISLSASSEFFTADGMLTLTAEATDNVAVRKVVFAQDGEVIAVDTEAPYTLDIDVIDTLNGRHLYTATAYDPTGNETTSESVRVLVAIGNRFFGTAPGDPEDYTDLLAHFDQLTPENAGKWGSVEAERDQMVWDDLDVAYDFAQDYGLPFKLHTLVWGNQEPGWVSGLPAAEQLEELDEWMGELAGRYPNLDMIDVVNEPLHNAPSYKEALGGDGDTGWDWVVTAFEMARAGTERGLAGVLRRVAVTRAEQYAQDEITARVSRFWEDLSATAKLEAADEYLREYGHLLPSELTEKDAARVKMNFPKVLAEHPRMMQRLSRIGRS